MCNYNSDFILHRIWPISECWKLRLIAKIKNKLIKLKFKCKGFIESYVKFFLVQPICFLHVHTYMKQSISVMYMYKSNYSPEPCPLFVRSRCRLQHPDNQLVTRHSGHGLVYGDTKGWNTMNYVPMPHIKVRKLGHILKVSHKYSYLL